MLLRTREGGINFATMPQPHSEASVHKTWSEVRNPSCVRSNGINPQKISSSLRTEGHSTIGSRLRYLLMKAYTLERTDKAGRRIKP